MQLQEPGRLWQGPGAGANRSLPRGVCGHQMPGCPGPNYRKWETCQVFYKIGHNLTVLSLKGCVYTLATQLGITKFEDVCCRPWLSSLVVLGVLLLKTAMRCVSEHF